MAQKVTFHQPDLMRTGAVRNSILSRLSRWLWGYDYFISYHWKSGGRYAVRLAEQLRQKGFDVFLDQAEFASGDNWEHEASKALASTQRLIVVATCEAVLHSEAVAKEVKHFSRPRRHIVPIVFVDENNPQLTYSDNDLLSVMARQNHLLADTTVHIKEYTRYLELGPSAATLSELVRTKGLLRRRSLRYLIVAATSAVLLLATIVSSTLGVFANAQKTIAESRFENLQSLTESTVTELYDIIQELPGALRHRELLVSNSMSYLDNLLAENPKNESTLNSVAVGYMRMGDVLGHPDGFSLGKTAEAITSWSKASEVTDRLIREHPKNSDYVFLDTELSIRFAMLDALDGKYAEAIERIETGEKQLDRLVATNPASWDTLLLKARIQMRKGDMLLGQAKFSDALVSFERACTLAEDALEMDNENRLLYANLASCQERIAGLKISAGELPAAWELAGQAVALREALESEEPYNSINLSRLANLYLLQGDISKARFENTSALEKFKRATEIRRRLYGDEPQNTSLVHSLATDLERLASAQQISGEIDDALASNEESLILRTRLVDLNPGNKDYIYHRAIALERLASLLKNHYELSSEEHQQEVEARYREALRLRKVLFDDAPESVEYRRAVAASELALGRYLFEFSPQHSDAEYLLESASSKFSELLKAYPDSVQNHKGAIRSLSFYGQFQESIGSDIENVLSAKRRSVSISNNSVNQFPDRVDLVKTRLVATRCLADSLFDSGVELNLPERINEASQHYESAIVLIRTLREYGVDADSLDGELAHVLSRVEQLSSSHSK